MTLKNCLPELSGSGDFYESSNVEVILQSIWVILVTRKGSRSWQPNFGCDLYGYIFDLNQPETTTNIKDEIENALTIWEPRIKILSVDVEQTGLTSISVTIEFKYENRDYSYKFPVTDDIDNMEFTIYNLKSN